MPTELATRALSFAPASIDEVERTVELIASTGAGVERWDMEGPFTEVLSLVPGACDLSRADGMPLLDSHKQDGLENVLGVVKAARTEKGKLIVTVKVSERHDAIWQDIKAGIIRNVSVGYEVQDFSDSQQGEKRTRTVSKWTLREVSLVPIGADPEAKTRSEKLPTTTTTNPTVPPASPAAPLMTRAEANAEIRALGETFEIEAPAINAMIDREASVEQARAEVIELVRSRQSRPAPAPRVTMVTDNESPDTFVARAAEALFCRSNPVHKPSDQARPYMGMTMKDLAQESLRLRSISTTGLGPADLVKRALSTSDFPALLGNAAHREVRASYAAAPAVLRTLARQTSAADFRAKNKIALGEAPTLEKVNERGEFKHGALAEAATSYKIDTFGKIIGLSRQAIVNDDLGAFSSLARIFGQSAAEFEAQFLVALLEGGGGNGPNMSDGKSLFHVDHGNKAAAAALGAPSEASLSAARAAMRKQKGLSGKPINVPPKFLLVPPELETLAEKMLAVVQPNSSGDVNPFGGKLALAVEARLSNAKRWYLSADTSVIDGLEYAYLAGEEGPQIDTRAGFEVDGLEIKCRLDFGAAFLDWRGWYCNSGE